MTKKQKNRDSIFFRAKRNDVYTNVCFSDLEETEMYEILKAKDEYWVRSLIAALIDSPFIAPMSDNEVRRRTCGDKKTLADLAVSLGNAIYNHAEEE